MRFGRENLRLYAVTDRAWTGQRSLYEQAEAALKNGVTCLQLREKNLDPAAFLEEAIAFRELCRRCGIPFIVNDNVEIAIKCGADGVHVGQEDQSPEEVRRLAGDSMVIGVSAHTVEEAVRAVRGGADYLGVGAVFSTSTKKNVTAMPLDTLKEICGAVDVPVVAIGGITEENLMALAGSGVAGIAAASAIFGAEDPGEAAKRLSRLSGEMTGKARRWPRP